MRDHLVEEVVAQRKGAIKIGPFGSALPRSAMVLGGVKVYGQENLISRDWSIGDRRITPETFELLRSCELYPGDVVIGMMGSLGHCEVFPVDAEPGLMDSHLLRIQTDRSLLTPDYLRILLLSEEIIRQIDRLSHGSIMAGLSSKVVRMLRILVPPLEEQRRITEVLDAIDRTITATEQIIHKLTTIKYVILNRLVSNVRGENVRLDSISILGGGNGFPEKEQGCRSGPLPFYKVSDMNNIGNEEYLYSANNYVDSATAEHYGWRIFPQGSIVFPKVGAALLSNRRRILSADSIIDNNMMAVVPLHAVSAEWLYFWLQTVDLTEFVQVGALPSVNQSLVGELMVTLPSRGEQQRQVRMLGVYSTRLNAETAQLKKLKSVRAGLTADLLSGRVRTVAA